MKNFRIGQGTEVHRGDIIPAVLTHRGDPMAWTLCDRDWRFAGKPEETDRPVTCPGCLRAMSQGKAA